MLRSTSVPQPDSPRTSNRPPAAAIGASGDGAVIVGLPICGRRRRPHRPVRSRHHFPGILHFAVEPAEPWYRFDIAPVFRVHRIFGPWNRWNRQLDPRGAGSTGSTRFHQAWNRNCLLNSSRFHRFHQFHQIHDDPRFYLRGYAARGNRVSACRCPARTSSETCCPRCPG